MKKVGKTTRPFRYDLNHLPYDYIVERTNRFKGLDLKERLPEELGSEVRDIVQETVTKTIPKKKKCKKGKWLSEEALQIAVKRKEAKSKGEKERYKHLNAEFQRIARRDKKVFLSDQCKEIEEGFLTSSCYSWNSAFRCLYLSFSPLLFASFLFTAICKASQTAILLFLNLLQKLITF